MLVASNAMNHQSGGPGISPPLPEALVKTLKNGQWKTSRNAADHHRRSIYIFARRNLRYPLFATFDRPAANCSCATRVSSTTAIQSLQLLNSKLTWICQNSWQTFACHNTLAILSTSCRNFPACCPVHPTIKTKLIAFLSEQPDGLGETAGFSTAELGAQRLCRAMFNSNEFLYVD